MLTDNTPMQKARHWEAFLLALGLAALIFLPFVVFDKGYFIYYGDFNVQQIPFYKLAHQAVRSGDIFWNWNTDLGVNFIGSYSFYLLFSPFFWLTLPFPTSWLPFLMAPLLVLKTGCACLTAYLYLSRFVKDTRYAVAGAMLYAFSGWMDFNIFFNHFHEVAVFFPLLLLGLELLVTENRRGVFAVAVLVNAMVNYWFFVGEVVFVLLYVIIRMAGRSWGMTLRKFLLVALEALLGVGMACFVLLPSVLALMGNPRTGSDELVTGWRFWLYWHEERQPAIILSLFFPPDLPARPNFFPNHGAKWGSLSAWLPMVSLSGVLAYFFARKNDWLKKLLALSLVFALVPGLNSLFILLNNSYYARWFYMPILLMALATARAVEDSEATPIHFQRAIKWTAIVMVIFLVMCGLTPNFEEGQLKFGMAEYPDMLWIYAAFALGGLVLTAYLVLYLRHHRRFAALFLAGIMGISLSFTIFYMANGKGNRSRSDYVINTALGGREQITLPQEGFARSDVYDGSDNLLMYWMLPGIQAFHSIVPPSIMEFYPEVGVKRDVGSRPEADYYALRPLLSVRWLFIQESKNEQTPMPGYTYFDTQAEHNIYENDNYIPMGFSYDYYVTREQLGEVAKELRGNLMLRAVVLEDEPADTLPVSLDRLDTSEALGLGTDAMAIDAAQRRSMAALDFTKDKWGFTAHTNYEKERLVFFSVPYEKGWSATVNGDDAPVIRANVGFMAVAVPAGDSVVRFEYRTPGLGVGIAVSAGCAVLLLISLLIARRRQGKEPPAPPKKQFRERLAAGEAVTLSVDEYLGQYSLEERRVKLQEALNQASLAHIEEILHDNEQTLGFQLFHVDNVENSGHTK